MTSDVFIIAEVGQAHDGSLGILHSYIDALATTGVDAIKFQAHVAEAESSSHEPFRVKFSYEDKTRYDYWKRVSFSLDQWKEIKEHCDKVGLEFICSPFSVTAVEMLEEIGVNKYKFGSGEVTNALMLELVAETGKDIIISSGMSSFRELDQAINLVKGNGNKLSILQCTTKYPTRPEDVGLNVISELKVRYPEFEVGLSDHSGTIYPSLAAVSLGATVLEAHVVFDRLMFGPDSESSLTINEFKRLTEGVRSISKMLKFPVDKEDNSGVSELKKIFEKSLAVRSDLPRGHLLTRNDLETKKPYGFGISASEYKKVIGKPVKRDMKQWDFLTVDDV